MFWLQTCAHWPHQWCSALVGSRQRRFRRFFAALVKSLPTTLQTEHGRSADGVSGMGICKSLFSKHSSMIGTERFGRNCIHGLARFRGDIPLALQPAPDRCVAARPHPDFISRTCLLTFSFRTNCPIRRPSLARPLIPVAS